MERFADRKRGCLGAIGAAQRATKPLHSYTLPVVSEDGKADEDKPAKQSESQKQLAAAEAAAKERFEKAMTELREGAYRFSSRARGQSELIVEELIDPEGETVTNLAEVEGDVGANALAQSLELITFDTWLFGQIGDKDALDLKDETHWEVWFSYGAWIGETMRRRHGGHWLLMGDDPHTWRLGFSKILLEIAPFVFAEQLLRMGSGATKKMVTEIERIRQLHDPEVTVGTRIEFAAGKAELPETVPALDELALFLAANDHVLKLGVDGYCDATDAPEAELQAISDARAKAVERYLVGKKVDPSRLHAEGHGAGNPRATADTDEARNENRRVEFDVLDARERRLLDRFLSHHYIRMHTVPLGQWLVMDFARLAKLWNEEAVEKLIAAIREAGPRLGPANTQGDRAGVRGAGAREAEGRAGREADDRPRAVRGDRADRRTAPGDAAGADRHPGARGDAGAARRRPREVPAARRG